MSEHLPRRYFLRNDGSALPAFSSEHASLFDTPDKSADILLTGGFSSPSREYSYFLSAALQLNGDCTDLDEDELKKFAIAELERRNRISYRSYTLDMNNQVCVLADDAEKLMAFNDTYGGLLEIESLLLKGCHHAFPAVTEVSISSTQKGYRLEYSSRSPVDYRRCTYCGNCAPSCPEKCIHENLFFDFNACTFCRECEKACPVDAIDMHGAERKQLNVPSLLILGDISLELPDDRSGIYSNATLENFFSTLFPCQVEEVITYEERYCHFHPSSQGGCRTCLDVCPSGALSADRSGIKLDSLKCTECGNCIGVCPTGALQDQRFTDEAFFEFFRSFPMNEGLRIILGEEKDLHQYWWFKGKARLRDTLFLEFPKLRSLTPLHLIFLLAHGASQVTILSSSPEMRNVLLNNVEDTNQLLGKWFDGGERIEICSIDTVTDTKEIKPLSGMDKYYSDLKYLNRRQKLSSILEFFTLKTAKEIEVESMQQTKFGTILCDENRCTQCMACLNDCKLEALSSDPAAMTLNWTGGLCIGCRICVSICPEKALSLQDHATLASSFFKPGILCQAEPVRCKECGKVFGTRKSFERVMKILAGRNMEKLGHFEYCEDCRVIKLMDSE